MTYKVECATPEGIRIFTLEVKAWEVHPSGRGVTFYSDEAKKSVILTICSNYISVIPNYAPEKSR